MATTCGDCLLFQGPRETCAGGKNRSGSSPSCAMWFKGPASLFDGKRCGGCRLFKGKEECGGGKSRSTTSPACNNYAPNPG